MARERAPFGGNRQIAVIAGEAVEHRAADDAAAALEPHGGPGRIYNAIYLCADKFGNARIGDDHDRVNS
jgi:hypothetical protein